VRKDDSLLIKCKMLYSQHPRKTLLIEAKWEGDKMKRKIKHKSHPRDRKTWCGLTYDREKEMADFIVNYVVGHWRRVTCKNCLKQRGR